ncbi:MULTISPECIES: protein kinase domain-containing protein [Psychrobacter]|uniref:protein kinase domain-containing protein n=1 Tax=Psychrobacter TaxID=497 RepID=UPI00191ACBCB|nr:MULTISPECIES: protein kinase [Psychrobacter]
MKNSASNPSITQALRTRAIQLLPILTAELMDLGYHKISHQRISQQDQYTKTVIYQGAIYQGLTRAWHKQFGRVMIKWELSPYNDDANHDIANYNAPNHSISDLSHEIAVLQTLHKSLQTQAQNNVTIKLSIAPPIWAYKSLSVNIINQNHWLTMLVMPYYPHGSLAYRLKDKEYPLLTGKQKRQLIIQAAHLITNLHYSGWLHNDIKPSNILLNGSFLLNNSLSNNTDYGSIIPKLLLTDFALANRFGEGFDKSVNKDSNQECTINAAGTAAYLAPERWQGQSATQQSDIYAFGITMYEVLAGRRPFKVVPKSSEPSKAWAIEHCQTPIPVLPEQYLYYQLIVNKALAKRVERRYKSMEEVLSDLEEF